MKVAIDILPLQTSHQYRGIGAYTRNLVDALQSIKLPNFSLQLIKQGKIPQDCNLVHYPYFDLFWLTLPLRKVLPTVVTIHDVIPLVFPDKFPKGIKGWLKFQPQRFSLKSVSAVITDSQNSKKDISQYLEIPREKIFVVPLAPNKEFKPVKSTKLVNSIKVKYSLPDEFILYVGDVNWNKNVEGLIKAMSNVKCQMSNVKLVLVGKAFEDKNLKETRLILQLIKELNLIDQTKILGWVPREDLVAICNLATVYCQPSFYEGFGLPVLEAMACGCPVVVANTSSLSEICGNAAVMVNPQEVNEMGKELVRVIVDGELRRKLIEKGIEQIKKFSWKKVAEQTVEVYQKVLRFG